MNIRPDTLFEFVAMKNNIALYQIFVWLVSNTYVVVLFIAPFYHICCICNKITTKFKYVWKFYVYGPYDGGKILNLWQNYIITNWKKCVSEMPWYDPLMIHFCGFDLIESTRSRSALLLLYCKYMGQILNGTSA